MTNQRTTIESSPVRVSVDMFGSLRRYLPSGEDGPISFSFDGPVTVGEALEILAIEPEHDMAISLNGELGAMDSMLKDGDSITLFGPMEGG